MNMFCGHVREHTLEFGEHCDPDVLAKVPNCLGVEYSQYTFFAVTRDPWRRAGSCWTYGKVCYDVWLAKKSDGHWAVKATDKGYKKRQADLTVPINDKHITLSLQAHNFLGGVVADFRADRGGQLMMYKPHLP